MHPHILIVTLPSQGHINPTLQLAKLLIRAGAHVTFFTSTSAGTRMSKSPNLDGLEFATFSDGYDHGLKQGDDVEKFMSQIERLGSQALIELIMASANEGRPFACLLYGVQIPWVAENKGDHPSSTIELPGLPLLNNSDLPSFLIPPKGNTYKFALPGFQKHLEMLNCESNPKVLINSFDALESEALGAINKFNLMGIGPLIPSAFLDGKDPSDTSFGGDLSAQQSEEIARGLLDGGRPFLWVIRLEENEEEKTLSCHEELERQGMMVPWCSQVEVLSHPSMGCFVTHSGWNSTLESLTSGVPVVAFPQWSDQATNAKLIEVVWKTGLRAMVNQEGIVEADEIKRCLELVMGSGERGEEMRRNATKWKLLAREAVKEGGSSDKNLKNFMNEVMHNKVTCSS
ncbi:Crocetin glucosyltransferase, chloroplastic [Vitis vinifera]|uniref:Glycosyltransferase n=1 Tax=Vitis vinifera TaxID=29760 RepID=A0A438CGH2_VITVI|nr:Crocetin glucosyltransferase, chloroplastic [Vitis vinifera]